MRILLSAIKELVRALGSRKAWSFKWAKREHFTSRLDWGFTTSPSLHVVGVEVSSVEPSM
jgi:hypothetical protein